MKTRKITLLVMIGFGLSACALPARHPRSGFAFVPPVDGPVSSYELDVQSEKRRLQTQWTQQELGFAKNQVLNEEQQQRVAHRRFLQDLEAEITTDSERNQYFAAKAHLQDDQERIHFLRLASLEERSQYLVQRGLASGAPKFNPQEELAIQNNDIVQGMRREAVRESWGEPEAREVAGDPLLGNERWSYRKYLSSPEGYFLETRTLYFEAGQLVGWKRSQSPP